MGLSRAENWFCVDATTSGRRPCSVSAIAVTGWFRIRIRVRICRNLLFPHAKEGERNKGRKEGREEGLKEGRKQGMDS